MRWRVRIDLTTSSAVSLAITNASLRFVVICTGVRSIRCTYSGVRNPLRFTFTTNLIVFIISFFISVGLNSFGSRMKREAFLVIPHLLGAFPFAQLFRGERAPANAAAPVRGRNCDDSRSVLVVGRPGSHQFAIALRTLPLSHSLYALTDFLMNFTGSLRSCY
jgi:magnesium-transporting ATPase (P-type)